MDIGIEVSANSLLSAPSLDSRIDHEYSLINESLRHNKYPDECDIIAQRQINNIASC